MIVRWPVGASTAFSPEEKTRIREKLVNRLNSADEIMLAVDDERSQAQNRDIAVVRLQTFVAQALIIPKPRRRTRPTRSSKEKRLEGKKRVSDVKKARKMINQD